MLGITFQQATAAFNRRQAAASDLHAAECRAADAEAQRRRAAALEAYQSERAAAAAEYQQHLKALGVAVDDAHTSEQAKPLPRHARRRMARMERRSA